MFVARNKARLCVLWLALALDHTENNPKIFTHDKKKKKPQHICSPQLASSGDEKQMILIPSLQDGFLYYLMCCKVFEACT